MDSDYTQTENDLITALLTLQRDIHKKLGIAKPIFEIHVSADYGRALGIPPGTGGVYCGVVVRAQLS